MGHDWIYELIRVAEYKNSLINNQFPPFWAENLYCGRGSPIFLYYAPLFLFISSIFTFLINSIAVSSILTLILLSLIASIGMYLLMIQILGNKSFISTSASRISMYFFILNPYLIGDKFLRNSNAEYTALCLTPISIYAILLIRKSPQLGSLILSIGFALVIISHNLTALALAASLIIISIIEYSGKENLHYWKYIIGALILGLALSSFFWLPALFYKSLVQTDLLVQGKFDFHNNFPSLGSFFFSTHIYSMGIVNLYVLITAFLILFSTRLSEKNKYRKPLVACLYAALFFILIQTKLSFTIWENVPFLTLFQFPWRMMGPLALIISIIAGLSFSVSCKKHSRYFIYKCEIIVLLLCIINVIPHLVSVKKIPTEQIHLLMQAINKNKIKDNIHTTTVADEYLPKNSHIDKNRCINHQNFMKNISSNNISILKISGTEMILDTKLQDSMSLQVERWYFPGWHYTINGQSHKIDKTQNNLIAITIPPGHNRVKLKLFPPLLREIFCYVSIISLFIWFVFVSLYFIKNRYV